MRRIGSSLGTILRWLYGLFFVAVSIWIGAMLLLGIGSPPSQPTASAQVLTDALSASGFIDPLLGITYFAGGLALLSERTAPLGIAILAPVVIVIVVFHWTLSGLIEVGVALAAIHALLVWRYRRRFACLWTA